jgi:hypothetical protein
VLGGVVVVGGVVVGGVVVGGVVVVGVVVGGVVAAGSNDVDATTVVVGVSATATAVVDGAD